MDNRDDRGRLEAMVNYLLGPSAKETVAKRMSGDIAELAVRLGDVREVLRLLRSGNLLAQYVAAFSLDLMGPLACEAGQDLRLLLDHPRDEVRLFGAQLIRECGVSNDFAKEAPPRVVKADHPACFTTGEMVMQVTVIEGHSATYADPIRFRAGDHLVLTGKADEWDGHTWLWAEGPDGKAGWVPDDIIENRNGQQHARRDYSAIELSCATGEHLIVIAETHGWAWCRSDTGKEGWVPLRNLSPNRP